MRVWLYCLRCQMQRVFRLAQTGLDGAQIFECESCRAEQIYPPDHKHKRYFANKQELTRHVQSVFRKHGLVK